MFAARNPYGPTLIEPGVTEIPLVMQDKLFTKAGELTYDGNPMQKHCLESSAGRDPAGNTEDPLQHARPSVYKGKQAP